MTIQRVGIVGFGDFGQFIFQLAKEKFPATSVQVSSIDRTENNETFFPLADVCASDVLFLCVPINTFEEVLKKIKPLLGANTLVVDVSTVKTYTSKVLRSEGIARFVATHPMFGPYSYAKHGNSLQDLRIAVCDSSLTPEENASFLSFLKEAGLSVFELTADEHDKLVAETLFLTHLVGQTIHKGKFERTAIDTVSFDFLMDAVESVQNDEALFQDVFMYNPYCAEVLKRYEEAERATVASLMTHASSR